MTKHLLLIVLTIAALGAIPGCKRSESGAESARTPETKNSAIPAGLFATLSTDGAASVLEAKSAAKEGETVLVRGRIGGSRSPFVDGRAMFTIVDASVLACSDTPGDSCRTPWDYCCEQPEDIAKHAATVQVRGTDGAVLRASLKGEGGLRELSPVIVRGTVAQTDGTVLVIDAEIIAVEGSEG